MITACYTIQQIASILGVKAHLVNPDREISILLTDSRKITDVKKSLFIALSERRDGHFFIKELYQKGIRNFLVSEKLLLSDYSDANIIVVDDTLKALQNLAAYHRKRFHYPVIGITGSNGKTMVKEWLFQLLSADYDIVRSPKSYNSQLGVPLSVWQMNDNYNLAIFEAGISTIDEMTALENIIKPNIGVLTHIGSAHDEGFKNTDEKINEKLKLFTNADVLICTAEYHKDYLKNYRGKLFSWSFNQPADLQIITHTFTFGKTEITAIYLGDVIKIVIPFTDQASIENSVICWSVLLQKKVNQQVIEDRMLHLQTVKMRLELKNGINNCSVIDDSYNSDFSSLEIALNFLDQQKQHSQKTLILSDIYQTGIKGEILYDKVANLLENKQIKKFIGIGENLFKYQNLFPKGSLFFIDTQSFLNVLPKLEFNNETILLKGARNFQFEKISKLLTQKLHETVLEINLNALEQNLNYYKTKLSSDTKIMAVVKAFSYGSGSFEIANHLQHHKVDYLAVAYADEGVALRKSGITMPIMVMSPDIFAFEAIVKHHLEPEIYSFRILKSFLEYINQNKNENYPVHIKLDTGMHRLGFNADDINELTKFLTDHPKLIVKSVFSHLAASETVLHDNYTIFQINLFKSLTSILESGLSYNFIKHLSNTSAISRWPQAKFDMVRLGIGLYGIDSVENEQSNLQNVGTLKTSISQIKILKPGETVGYNRKGILPNGGKIATVKIGYADGYPRLLGNGKGKMFINGKVAPTIGGICMDMCMLDITDIDAAEGDEVIVFDSNVTIKEMAESLETIPYEILTNISQRVKRIYYYE